MCGGETGWHGRDQARAHEGIVLCPLKVGRGGGREKEWAI